MIKNNILINILLALVFSAKLIAQEKDYREYMSDYDVYFYHLNLEFSDTSTYINGNTMIYAQVSSDTLNRIILDLSSELQIDSVKLNNDSLYFQHYDDIIICENIPLLTKNNNFIITVYYNGFDDGENDFFKGGVTTNLHYNTGINATWTMSEPYAAKKWFACKQDLTDKADSVYFYITVADNLKAGSNGLLKKIVPLSDNKVRYEWESKYPIEYYLISATVGNFMEYNIYAHPPGTDDSLLIQNYIYNNAEYLETNRSVIFATADLVELFSDIFGIYPFMSEKYGHCTAPIGGGMEHQTMTTLNSFSFLLVAHELAHMWFGNSVTCSTWNDIWINEGFASYSEYIALEDLGTGEDMINWLLSAQKKALKASTGSVYVPTDQLNDPWRIFNSSLSYKKGACLLHMIRFELNNDSIFFEVLRSFLQTYKNNVAGAEDFKEVLEEVSQVDFTTFFQQWYYGEGYPIFTISWTQENDTLTIKLEQTGSSEMTTFFESDFEIDLRSINKDSLFRFRQTQNIEEFIIHYPDIITEIIFDPNFHLLKKLKSNPKKIPYVPEHKLFRVSPNPCHDNFTLHFKTFPIDCIINITDVDGKQFYNKKATQKHIDFDVSSWKSGIYFINVLYNNALYSEKIIKN